MSAVPSVQIIVGDSRGVLRTLPDASVDSVVTDPPYALVSIVKRFGSPNAAPAKVGASGVYARASAGFMGQSWDTGETAFAAEFWEQVLRVLKPGGHVLAFSGTRTSHRLTCAIEDAGFEIRDMIAWVYGTGFPKSHNLDGDWQGWGTALKPALEPITVARKPLVGTVADNVLAYGTGALNINGGRVDVVGGTTLGRWPANLIHDGSDEVVSLFPGEAGAAAPASGAALRGSNQSVARGKFNGLPPEREPAFHSDTGSAARFFYCAKASKSDRGEGNNHPTVKPTDLMRYLCRLVTPPGGLVLDPFMGSGSTGKAAALEGFRFLGVEREEKYAEIARARLGLPPENPLEMFQ